MTFELIVREVRGRKLRLFFASPIGYYSYNLFGVTLFVVFCWGEAFFARISPNVRPIFDWIPVLFFFCVCADDAAVERRAEELEPLSSSSPYLHARQTLCWASSLPVSFFFLLHCSSHCRCQSLCRSSRTLIGVLFSPVMLLRRCSARPT